ncbi:hypothetical protein CPJCM30710_21300 [Clostridium polyendosporum]|uniref:Spore germination protein (Amino acid permease) n=1 Tax=Clostridium polyendosporum TaxID=69208 RepID=A0A919S119_9CLOT|nr:endospore germination permease [Clostridium polyendosporum]GIM29464.1 hypothetical protein CPJCM30710_21300 [Clostridium polyendosporum]
MEKLTSKHLSLLVFVVSVVSLRTYPSLFVRQGGRDTWIFTIVASVLFFIYVLYLINVCEKTSTLDFNKIVITSLGKAYGNLYLGIFVVTLLLTAIRSAAVEANAIHVSLFVETPIWFALLFFIPAAGYAASKDFDSLIVITIVSTTFVLLSGVILSLLLIKTKRINYLLPILRDVLDVKYIYSTIEQLGAYSSFAIVLPLLAQVQHKEKLKRHILIAVILAIIVAVSTMIGGISTFGHMRFKNILYPRFIQSQQMPYKGFIENGQLFAIFNLVNTWFLKYLISIYCALLVFKDRLRGINKSLIIAILSVVIYIGAYFAAKNTFVLFRLLRIYHYISLVVFFIVPIIIFTIYRLKTSLNKCK